MRNFRKLISLLLAVLLILPVGTLSFTATASSDSIKVGDTLTLGTYLDEPIVWRCVSIDENGPLMLSDKILCFKSFDAKGNYGNYYRNKEGTNNWKDSALRHWLNSSGTVDWSNRISVPSKNDVFNGYNPYNEELGFLTGFSEQELSMIKTVTQKSYINALDKGKSAGGSTEITHYDGSLSGLYRVTNNLANCYYQNTQDSIFLLGIEQLEAAYKNMGTEYFKCKPTAAAVKNDTTGFTDTDTTYNWWLRIPATCGMSYENVKVICGDTQYGTLSAYSVLYGSNYHSAGVRPAFYLDLEKYEASNLSEESQAYIQQHINFVNSTKYSNLMHKATFYDSIWQYESTSQNFTALTGWKVLGDIGKVASLNFSNLLITENPYDAILADILSNYTTDNAILSVCSSVLDVVFEIDSDCDKLMKILQSSDEWDDSIDVSKVKETIKQLLGESKKSLIDGVFFSTKEYKLKEKHAQVYEILTKCFSKIDASKWNSLFSNLNNISTIIGYINSATDIVEVIFDAYQQYIIAKALVTSNIDVLGSLVSAGYYLPPIAQDLLVESTKKYLEVLDYDSAFGAVCNYMIGGSVKNVYEIFKGSLKTVIYTGIANLFDVSAGSINAIIFTFNTTYTILDSITGLGDMSKTFLLLDSAAMLEDALCEVTENIANNLKSKCTLTNAARLDACWGLLQSVEGYCYSSLSNYISGLKKTYTTSFVIKTGIGSFFTSIIEAKKLSKNLNDANAAIQVAVMFDNEWKNANCHGESSSSSKTVSVKCPTDVYVYDENNELMLTIINNTIEKLNFKFSAIVDGTEKIFALPNGQNYSIKIVGTDTGTMTYSIFDLSEINIINFTEYENLALRKDCVYEGILYNDTNDTYDLEMTKTGICKHTDNNNDGTCDICGKDMTENCKCICHSKNIFVQFVWEILCAVFRFLDIDAVRYCDCGAAHW